MVLPELSYEGCLVIHAAQTSRAASALLWVNRKKCVRSQPSEKTDVCNLSIREEERGRSQALSMAGQPSLVG